MVLAKIINANPDESSECNYLNVIIKDRRCHISYLVIRNHIQTQLMELFEGKFY